MIYFSYAPIQPGDDAIGNFKLLLEMLLWHPNELLFLSAYPAGALLCPLTDFCCPNILIAMIYDKLLTHENEM